MNNPFSDLLTGYRHDQFFGREQEVRTVLQAATGAAPQSYRFHGLRTIGKTTLLRYLADPLGAVERQKHVVGVYGRPGQGTKLISLYLDLFNTSGDNVLFELCRAVVNHPALRGIAPSGLTAAEPDCSHPDATRQLLNEVLRALTEASTRLLLCLDHFDQAFETMAIADQWHLREMAQYHALVIATERSLADLSRNRNSPFTSPLLNAVRPRTLGPLLQREAEAMAEDVLARWEIPRADPTRGDQAGDVEIRRAAQEFVLKLGGRQPYLLTLVGEWLLERVEEETDLGPALVHQEGNKVTARLMVQLEAEPALDELFLAFWNRLNPHEQAALAALAGNLELDPERGELAVGSLQQKALLSAAVLSEKPALFSDLFAAYVRRKHALRAEARPEADRGRIAEGRPTDYAPVAASVDGIIARFKGQDRVLAELLKTHPNELFSSDDLKERLATNQRGLEASILRIRKALREQAGGDWEYIQNVRERGYRYVPRLG